MNKQKLLTRSYPLVENHPAPVAIAEMFCEMDKQGQLADLLLNENKLNPNYLTGLNLLYKQNLYERCRHLLISQTNDIEIAELLCEMDKRNLLNNAMSQLDMRELISLLLQHVVSHALLITEALCELIKRDMLPVISKAFYSDNVVSDLQANPPKLDLESLIEILSKLNLWYNINPIETGALFEELIRQGKLTKLSKDSATRLFCFNQLHKKNLVGQCYQWVINHRDPLDITRFVCALEDHGILQDLIAKFDFEEFVSKLRQSEESFVVRTLVEIHSTGLFSTSCAQENFNRCSRDRFYYFGTEVLELLNQTDLLKGNNAQSNFVALTDWFSNIFANHAGIYFTDKIIKTLIKANLLHTTKATDIFRFIMNICTYEKLSAYDTALKDMYEASLLNDPDEAYKNIEAIFPHCSKGCFSGFIKNIQNEGLLTVPAVVKRFSQLCDLFEDVSRQGWVVDALKLLYKKGALGTQNGEMYVDIIMTHPDPLACARWLNQYGSLYQTKEDISEQLAKMKSSSQLEICLRELTADLPSSTIQNSGSKQS